MYTPPQFRPIIIELQNTCDSAQKVSLFRKESIPEGVTVKSGLGSISMEEIKSLLHNKYWVSSFVLTNLNGDFDKEDVFILNQDNFDIFGSLCGFQSPLRLSADQPNLDTIIHKNKFETPLDDTSTLSFELPANSKYTLYIYASLQPSCKTEETQNEKLSELWVISVQNSSDELQKVTLFDGLKSFYYNMWIGGNLEFSNQVYIQSFHKGMTYKEYVRISMDKAPTVEAIDATYLDNTEVDFTCTEMNVNCDTLNVDTNKKWQLDGTTKIKFEIEPHTTIHVSLKVSYSNLSEQKNKHTRISASNFFPPILEKDYSCQQKDITPILYGIHTYSNEKEERVNAIQWNSQVNIEIIKHMLGELLISEQRDGCAVVGTWLKSESGDNTLICFNDFIVKDIYGNFKVKKRFDFSATHKLIE